MTSVGTAFSDVHDTRCVGGGPTSDWLVTRLPPTTPVLRQLSPRRPPPLFTDASLRLLPASWQDTGSGVFPLAATAVLLGVGVLAAAPARRTIGLAVLCGPAAFLVDVYLY
jgi:hypothetical protein